MKILSHRGLWRVEHEQNSLTALTRSLEHNFGIELDIRDCLQKIVVSHDPPSGGELLFETFLQRYVQYKPVPLAINIKSDGLSKELSQLISNYGVVDYFTFDMSICETVKYANQALQLFIRHSDLEKELTCYNWASGLWMDELCSSWIDVNTISRHLEQGKRVCLVSPEIHGRDFLSTWYEYRQIGEKMHSDNFMLCTDFPEEAARFFGIENEMEIDNK